LEEEAAKLEPVREKQAKEEEEEAERLKIEEAAAELEADKVEMKAKEDAEPEKEVEAGLKAAKKAVQPEKESAESLKEPAQIEAKADDPEINEKLDAKDVKLNDKSDNEKEEKNNPLLSAMKKVEVAPPFESIVSATKSLAESFLPAPSLDPPTPRNINNNIPQVSVTLTSAQLVSMVKIMIFG